MEFKSMKPNTVGAKVIKSFNLPKTTVDRFTKYCAVNKFVLSYAVDTILVMYLDAIENEAKKGGES